METRAWGYWAHSATILHYVPMGVNDLARTIDDQPSSYYHGLQGTFRAMPHREAASQTKGAKTMTAHNETLATIDGLSTTHGTFSDQPVADADLNTILQASLRAANASARQSYSIVVVVDRERQKALTGYCAGVTLVYCIDYNRHMAQAEHLGLGFDGGGFTLFVTGATDAALVAQTAAIAARSLGLDYMFTNGLHRGDVERVYKLLDLPRSACFPLIALLLGRAENPATHQKGRLTGTGVIHWDRYHLPEGVELDQLVAQYDNADLNLAVNSAWHQQGFEHYLQWLYEVRSPRRKPGEGKRQLQAIAERSGFFDV